MWNAAAQWISLVYAFPKDKQYKNSPEGTPK